jgi:hypothetical protein
VVQLKALIEVTATEQLKAQQREAPTPNASRTRFSGVGPYTSARLRSTLKGAGVAKVACETEAGCFEVDLNDGVGTLADEGSLNVIEMLYGQEEAGCWVDTQGYIYACVRGLEEGHAGGRRETALLAKPEALPPITEDMRVWRRIGKMTGQTLCWKCGKVDHLARDCPGERPPSVDQRRWVEQAGAGRGPGGGAGSRRVVVERPRDAGTLALVKALSAAEAAEETPDDDLEA